MKVEKYSKQKDNRYKVVFDDGTSVILYDDVIVKYDLLLRKNLSEKDFFNMLEYNNSLEAYYKAIKYLGIKMRTRIELNNYLKRFEYSQLTIDGTIDKIEKEGYLNNEAYVKAYINDQISLSQKGPYKIKGNLIELGIPEKLIYQELNKIDESFWEERVKDIVNKKINVKSNDSAKKRKEKLNQYLINLGYSNSQIIASLNQVELSNDFSKVEKEGKKILIKLKKKYTGYDLKMHLISKMQYKGFEYEEINLFLEKFINN